MALVATPSRTASRQAVTQLLQLIANLPVVVDDLHTRIGPVIAPA
jgi:hypothetical protein